MKNITLGSTMITVPQNGFGALPIQRISKENAVNLLRRAGSRLISAETLAADFEAGAPRNEDGTVNLIEYAAWLVKGDDDADQSE